MKQWIAAATTAITLGACSGQDSLVTSSQTQQGLNLTFDILDDTDISTIEITITEVDCDTGLPIPGGNTQTAVVDYEDMLIPGANPDLAGMPYDQNSGHIFADQFFFVSPGCYDVVTQPLDENGNPSRDCRPAHYNNVQVFSGSTTEIHLIMQCRGEDPGGLDVIASINHPPSMTDLVFEPSKFSCEETVTVCVSASDPDSDPLSFEWNIPAGGTLLSQTLDTGDGATTACATIAFAGPGDYEVEAVVYDMGYDTDGNLVTIESLLTLQGDPSPSHTSLSFPVHILSPEDCLSSCNCEPPYMATPAGDACVLTDTVPATSSGVFHQVCEGDEITSYGWQGARYPGGTYETNSYWGDGTSINGRLVDVGVWTCDADGGPGTQPVGEWIGFSLCLDIAEAGDYLLGTGADNRMRFFVDGNLEFATVSSLTENFNAWWINPIHLSSGIHIIEVEGYNDGSWAAFGADISGPFPTGSLTNDASMQAANYAGNIIFSTQDMVGQEFQTGEFSGWSCPDGYAVNTCGQEPECTLISYRDCE